MALQRATPAVPLFPIQTQTDSPPAGVYDLAPRPTPDVTYNVGAQMTGASGVGAASTTFQVFPNGTNMTATSGATLGAANNKGWQIPPTTYMGATASTPRVITSGSTLAQDAYFINANSSLGATCTFAVYWYKRAAGGALSAIANASANVVIPAAASNATIGDVIATSSALGADVVFAAGETLYMEFYVTIPGAVTANSLNMNINTAGAEFFKVSPNGIGFRYTSTATDSAPVSSDNVARTVIRPRAVSDSAPAADVLTRSLNITRSSADSAPAADVTTRQLIVVRKTNEYLGGTPDYPVTTPATITGLVTNGGIAQAGAVCRLLRDSDEFLAATVTTGADGRYTFTRDKNDPNTYHVEVYVGTTLHGLSDRGLTPS